MKIWLWVTLSIIFFPVAYLAFIGHVFGWENRISVGIQDSEMVTFLATIELLSIFGNYFGLIISFSTLILLAFWLKGFVIAVWVSTVSLSQFILIEILKTIIGRPRPFPIGETVFDSFPSGQAFYSLVFFSLLWCILNPYLPKWIYQFLLISFCILATITVGVLRIHSGQHWPTDVLGSWIIGGFISPIFVLAVGRGVRQR